MTKIELARNSFESLKAQGLPVTKSAVAKLGGFSRSLLSACPDGTYKSEDWKRLSTDIAAYQSADKPTKAKDRYRNKMLELRNARDEMKRKYHAQVEQNAGLLAEVVMLKQESTNFKSAFDKVVEEKDKLQSQYSSLSAQFRPYLPSKDNITPFASSVIVSPDNELMRISGGEYKWNSLLARQAHNYSHKKLREVLARPLPKRLYILIGRPGSGKSSWIMMHHAPSDQRLAIYYDATNATVADRWEIMEMAKESNVVIVCYVYFIVDIKTCIRNSKKRKNKVIQENIIRNLTIDPPELSEGFDELIIVQGGR